MTIRLLGFEYFTKKKIKISLKKSKIVKTKPGT